MELQNVTIIDTFIGGDKSLKIYGKQIEDCLFNIKEVMEEVLGYKQWKSQRWFYDQILNDSQLAANCGHEFMLTFDGLLETLMLSKKFIAKQFRKDIRAYIKDQIKRKRQEQQQLQEQEKKELHTQLQERDAIITELTKPRMVSTYRGIMKLPEDIATRLQGEFDVYVGQGNAQQRYVDHNKKINECIDIMTKDRDTQNHYLMAALKLLGGDLIWKIEDDNDIPENERIQRENELKNKYKPLCCAPARIGQTYVPVIDEDQEIIDDQQYRCRACNKIIKRKGWGSHKLGKEHKNAKLQQIQEQLNQDVQMEA